MRRLLLALVPALGCAEAPPAEPTFGADIGPLLRARCGACHFPGGPGPFALLEYDDVARRAAQVLEVVQSGFMPPWLPAGPRHAFAGDRRLDEGERALLARWVGLGAPAGDLTRLAAPEARAAGWLHGVPDLVVPMPVPFDLRAEGEDVVRNFVLPVPLDGPVWIGAVEIDPGVASVVHHGELMLDAGGSCRRLATLDPEPGFDGMRSHGARKPDGHFIGWTPGHTTPAPRPDLAWRLEPGTDLVLQLHLLPSGKRESVRARVGLHFAAQPPRLRPALLHLGSALQDLPAGSPNTGIEDRFVLPESVSALGLYPHAHYLGKDFLLTARLPDGTTRELLRIERWDFDWQDEYRFAEPPRLPAGTELRLAIRYDNSAENPRNPHSPPRRVVFGPRSDDEMGDLWLQLVAEDPARRPALIQAAGQHELANLLAGFEAALGRAPEQAQSHFDLGSARLAEGRVDLAVPLLTAALEREPNHVEARYNLGLAFATLGAFDRAATEFAQTLEVAPDLPEALLNLGLMRESEGRAEEALELVRHAAERAPRSAAVQYNLGLLLAQRESYAEAAAALERAVTLAPEYAPAWNNLGAVRIRLRDGAGAIQALQRALELDPTSESARKNLDQVRARAAAGR